MSVRVGGVLLLGVALVIVACERIPRAAQPGDAGTVPGESLATVTEIPARWGSLVSVTHPEWAMRTSLLWFQDADGVVRVASYDHVARRFRPWASVVRRTP